MRKPNIKIDFSHFKHLLNINVLKNVVYFSGGIIVFICGVIIYGLILNTRIKPLSEVLRIKGMKSISNPKLIIDRKTFTLNLFDNDSLIKTYRANFGRNLNAQKQTADDGATPIGIYRVVAFDTSYTYYKFIKINYPNVDDAAEALRKNLITSSEFDSIKFFDYYSNTPKYSNVLGGNMGIHGIGKYNSIFKNLPFNFNWTDGNISISNEDIDELISVLHVGDTVVIK